MYTNNIRLSLDGFTQGQKVLWLILTTRVEQATMARWEVERQIVLTRLRQS